MLTRIFPVAVLVLVSIAGAPSAQAQVLNTRPLSQPYINPNNPNAGTMGSRSTPGYREASPGPVVQERQTLDQGQRRAQCWTDSLGQRHCQAAR